MTRPEELLILVNGYEVFEMATKSDEDATLQTNNKVWVPLVLDYPLSGWGALTYGGGKRDFYTNKVATWHTSKKIKPWPNDKWLGPLNVNWKIFNEDPNRPTRPWHVRQGIADDCWHLAPQAALVHKGFGEVKEMFSLPPEANLGPNGGRMYPVKFYRDGVRVVITVEDFFPCNEHAQLIYAQGLFRQLFVCLSEKTFARICTNYKDLDGNVPRCIVSHDDGITLWTTIPASIE